LETTKARRHAKCRPPKRYLVSSVNAAGEDCHAKNCIDSYSYPELIVMPSSVPCRLDGRIDCILYAG